MTGGQLANGIGSAMAATSSLIFILAYSLMARWYKTFTGRFMVAKAAGVFFTCLITIALTANDFTAGVDWLRYVQAAVWVLIGSAYISHIYLIWITQRRQNDHQDG
jgi:hypothetical protein